VSHLIRELFCFNYRYSIRELFYFSCRCWWNWLIITDWDKTSEVSTILSDTSRKNIINYSVTQRPQWRPIGAPRHHHGRWSPRGHLHRVLRLEKDTYEIQAPSSLRFASSRRLETARFLRAVARVLLGESSVGEGERERGRVNWGLRWSLFFLIYLCSHVFLESKLLISDLFYFQTIMLDPFCI
jgi:hypothetical protein